jgi:hypothetical protein
MCDNCYEIFNFLNPQENTMLFNLNKNDLKELIFYLNKCYLELRDTIGLSLKDTFGLELECESDLDRDELIKLFSHNSLIKGNDWIVCKDNSIIKGCEIDSAILRDRKSDWLLLSEICSLIKNYSFIGQNSAGHIHIGAHILGTSKDSWMNFILLWAVFEDIIYRFCYGEFLTNRSRLAGFAPPIARTFIEDYNKIKGNPMMSINEIVLAISHNRKSQSVNFLNVKNLKKEGNKNTIEFRCPNGSLNPVIWQNNVNLFARLLYYSKSSNFDKDVIFQYCDSMKNRTLSVVTYRRIDLLKACKLADLIFPNNLEKIYFLRQYLKSYQMGLSELELAKPFVYKKI